MKTEYFDWYIVSFAMSDFNFDAYFFVIGEESFELWTQCDQKWKGLIYYWPVYNLIWKDPGSGESKVYICF